MPLFLVPRTLREAALSPLLSYAGIWWLVHQPLLSAAHRRVAGVATWPRTDPAVAMNRLRWSVPELLLLTVVLALIWVLYCAPAVA